MSDSADKGERKRLTVNYHRDPAPVPVFADHVESIGVNNLAIVTFYANAFPPGLRCPEDVPDNLDAYPVVRVVLPLTTWSGLIDGLIAAREKAAGAEREG